MRWPRHSSAGWLVTVERYGDDGATQPDNLLIAAVRFDAAQHEIRMPGRWEADVGCQADGRPMSGISWRPSVRLCTEPTHR